MNASMATLYSASHVGSRIFAFHIKYTHIHRNQIDHMSYPDRRFVPFSGQGQKLKADPVDADSEGSEGWTLPPIQVLPQPKNYPGYSQQAESKTRKFNEKSASPSDQKTQEDWFAYLRPTLQIILTWSEEIPRHEYTLAMHESIADLLLEFVMAISSLEDPNVPQDQKSSDDDLHLIMDKYQKLARSVQPIVHPDVFLQAEDSSPGSSDEDQVDLVTPPGKHKRRRPNP